MGNIYALSGDPANFANYTVVGSVTFSAGFKAAFGGFNIIRSQSDSMFDLTGLPHAVSFEARNHSSGNTVGGTGGPNGPGFYTGYLDLQDGSAVTFDKTNLLFDPKLSSDLASATEANFVKNTGVTPGNFVLNTVALAGSLQYILAAVFPEMAVAKFILTAGAASGLSAAIGSYLKAKFFPTDAEDKGAIQTTKLYYGDAPTVPVPSQFPKLSSGYVSQVNQLSNMSVGEIRTFVGDFISNEIINNVNNGLQVIGDVNLKGAVWDNGQEDLRDNIATQIKDWASGIVQGLVDFGKANGTGTGGGNEGSYPDLVDGDPPPDVPDPVDTLGDGTKTLNIDYQKLDNILAKHLSYKTPDGIVIKLPELLYTILENFDHDDVVIVQ